MALGGLFSCIAQQLRVNIEFNEPYKITHSHSKYPHEPSRLPANRLTLKLTDLNADEKRNLIFQLHVPKVDNQQNTEMASQQIMSQDEQPSSDEHSIGKDKFVSSKAVYMHRSLLGQVTVIYVEPNSEQTITTSPVSFQLIRTAQPAADLLQVNYTLDIQRNRVETAREIKRAMDESNYQGSLAILKAQVEKIKSSVSGQDPFCQLLIKDLEYRYPSERDYRSSHFNNYMQHSSERGTYAPMGNISSVQYQQQAQQQQVVHFLQQQPPRQPTTRMPYLQCPPIYPQQQQPPPYTQQQQPPPYLQPPQLFPYAQQQQQQPPPYAQQQQLPPNTPQQPQQQSTPKKTKFA